MTAQIIKHHIKYKEIHGIDEVILMTRSDHSKLHRRLRKEGKCNIPVEELQIISGRAGQRKPDIIHENNLVYTQQTHMKKVMLSIDEDVLDEFDKLEGFVTRSAHITQLLKNENIRILSENNDIESQGIKVLTYPDQ